MKWQMKWQMGRRVLLLSMRPTPSTGVRWCGTATQTLMTSSSRDSSSGVLARAGVLQQPAAVAAVAAGQRRSRKMMMHVRYVRLQRQRRTLPLTGGGGTHGS